jgi:hypothetical protein
MTDPESIPAQIDPSWRAELVDRRKQLDAIEGEAAKGFDQGMLAVSASSLGLSLTFIKDLAPKPLGMSAALVAIAWILLTASTLSIVWSFMASQFVTRERIDDIDRQLSPGREPAIPRSRRPPIWIVEAFGLSGDDLWGQMVDRLNDISLVSFSAGLACLVAFCVANYVFG